MAADRTARNVAERVDALAAALRAAGVSPERSAGLLAAAATAAMNAVMLDALLEEGQAAAPVPVAEAAVVEQQPIRLAA
jgi:non-ribosomal peptide synthetase component F